MEDLDTKGTSLNMSSIIEEEEKDNFIYSIREKLMQNVMREIDRVDLNTRTIEFIVDIGCEALWRMLNIEFIEHRHLPHIHAPPWQGDSCIKPSQKDTMVCRTVPIAPTTKPEKEHFEHPPKVVCECLLGTPCECTLPAYKRDKIYMRILDETPPADDSGTVIDEEVEDESSLEEEENLTYVESESKDASSFYNEVSDSSLLPSVQSSIEEVGALKCVLSEGFSKLTEKKKPISLPQLNVTHMTKSIAALHVTHLPTIRTPIKHDYRTVAIEPKIKKK